MPKRTNTIVNTAELVKISEGPKELLQWFELLNLLPLNYEVYAERLEELREEWIRDPEDAPYLQRYLRLVGPKLANRLSGKRFVEAVYHVRGLYASRQILISVISAFEVWDKQYQRGDLPPGIIVAPAAAVTINFNADTSLEVPSLRLLILLITPIQISKKKRIPLPIERVRVCPICLKFHWASRLDAETCGDKNCARTLGNRKRSKPKKEKRNGDIQT